MIREDAFVGETTYKGVSFIGITVPFYYEQLYKILYCSTAFCKHFV